MVIDMEQELSVWTSATNRRFEMHLSCRSHQEDSANIWREIEHVLQQSLSMNYQIFRNSLVVDEAVDKKKQEIAAAFDDFIDLPGLRARIQLGALQRLLALKCDEVSALQQRQK